MLGYSLTHTYTCTCTYPHTHIHTYIPTYAHAHVHTTYASAHVTNSFSLHLQASTTTVNITVSCCHPGYNYEDGTCQYVRDENRHILRADQNNKYIYLRVSLEFHELYCNWSPS